MSTSVQPENNQPVLENQENPQQNQEGGTQSTNPPAQPQGRVYTEEQVRTIHELYGQTLRENEQRLQEALRNQQQTNSQPQNRQSEEEDFLTNPRNVIGDEIEKRLQPFSTYIQQQQAQNVYNGLKEQFKRHPTYAAFFNIPQAEMLLDQQVAQMPPANVNTQSIAGLISQIYGYMQLNNMVPTQPVVNNNQYQQQAPTQNWPQPNNQPMNPPNNNQQTLPPHLRPSAPPMPTNGGQNLTPKGNVRRPLTELERRVMKEQGFSNPDDYIDFMMESPTNVYRSDIGRPNNG